MATKKTLTKRILIVIITLLGIAASLIFIMGKAGIFLDEDSIISGAHCIFGSDEIKVAREFGLTEKMSFSSLAFLAFSLPVAAGLFAILWENKISLIITIILFITSAILMLTVLNYLEVLNIEGRKFKLIQFYKLSYGPIVASCVCFSGVALSSVCIFIK